MEALAPCFRLALAPSADATSLGKSAKSALDQVCTRLICTHASDRSVGQKTSSADLENILEWATIFMSRAHALAQVDTVSALNALVVSVNWILCVSDAQPIFRTWTIEKRIQMSTVSSLRSLQMVEYQARSNCVALPYSH
jgi:hypothetical protein